MRDIRELGEHELDALREVANIGAGHAATALSQLTNRRILVDVPQIRFAGLRVDEEGAEAGAPEDLEATVSMQVLGDITGRTMQVFPGPTASRLAGILIGSADVSFPEAFGELEQSALKEAGNILSAAYMNALSDFMGLMLLPSVPSLVIDISAAVLTTAYTNFGHERDYVFCIQTEFSMEKEESVQGHFLLLPDVESLEVILRSIRLA